MKITRVETIRLLEFLNALFVEVFTDEGVVGLAETFRGIEKGMIRPLSKPGMGTALQPDIRQRPDCIVRSLDAA